MCRICGRMFKCVLDSMPSRTPTLVQNSRSFLLLIPRQAEQSSSFSTLSTSFSRLLLHSSSPLALARPKLPSTHTSTNPPSTSQSQSSPLRMNRMTFSTSASLGAKRNTYNPSRRVQKRRSGFLARVKTRTGRSLLARRRLKGRKDLSY